jgi:hypothetical protein
MEEKCVATKLLFTALQQVLLLYLAVIYVVTAHHDSAMLVASRYQRCYCVSANSSSAAAAAAAVETATIALLLLLLLLLLSLTVCSSSSL